MVLATDTKARFEAAVEAVVATLTGGGVVALPTETVYGLAANAFDASAVARVCEIKGRPTTNPVIVHVADIAMARRCCSDWAEVADQLAKAFWPGPLTLVLPKSELIPDVVTAGGETVGVRWSSHPFIQAVIRRCGFPLAAPSANRSMSISPTNVSHVRQSLGNRVSLIVDGGQAQVGVESTVLDLTVDPVRVLRPGMVHKESLLSVLDAVSVMDGGGEQVAKSPGLMARHYAPEARLIVLRWDDDDDLERQIKSQLATGQRVEVHVVAHTRIPSLDRFAQVSVMPHDPEAFARALYSELHRCDAEGAELIVVEAVPKTSPWSAIRDRLKRAAVALP